MTRVDLLITGRIATLAGQSGFGWTNALAIDGGRIVEVESGADVEARERWDLGDELVVMPGITDAHLHLMNVVMGESQLDITGTDLRDGLARIGARHAQMLQAGNADGWLLGHGWALHDFGEWPDADLLETVARGRPIALYAHDHHTRWVSRRAMELAGIGDASADPGGGMIRRGEDGRPTGILHEVASILVDPASPPLTPHELRAGLARVAAGLAGLGITGCHDPGELTADRDITRGPVFYRSVAEEGALPLRVHSSIRAVQLERAVEMGLVSGARTGRYRMGWLKLFADGSLGSRSAALLAPYEDAAANVPTGGPSGMVLTDAEELTELLTRAAQARIAGQIHAIGDAAVRMVLNVFEATTAGRDLPLMRRVEHAQLVDPADVPRFASLGVAASVQPVHLRSDARAARVAWGDRSHNTFPLGELDRTGALIPIGTDAPIEPVDPWPGIAVAVARRDPFDSGERQTGASHAIDLVRAIRAACLDPQIVAGETDLGRLTAGSRADLIVVPASGFVGALDPADLASKRPLATLMDGQLVYRSPSFNP
ncbi:MAG: amidohydrolase [Candidatus Limnocylindrales bacterium]